MSAEKKHRKNAERAVLTILSAQSADGETDRSELNTTAFYSYSDSEIIVSYTELDDTGTENGETVITVLRDGLVTIHKTGFTEAVMVLERGKTHPVKYETILGTMEMLLCALDVRCDFHPGGGRLQLRYLIDIGDNYSAVNTIDLRVSLR